MPTKHISSVEALEEDTCWALLESVDLGRLAIRTSDDVDIFPVNYLIKNRKIFFRSAPGAKLAEIREHPRVAFEADGTSDRLRWSVVVRGVAERLSHDAEIIESGLLEMATLTPVDKWNYVGITPTSISGRRFRAGHHVS